MAKKLNFVNYAIARIKKDNAFKVSLRRANNPATECQAWEYLAPWCDITKEWENLPFSIVGAAIGTSEPKTDGDLSLGKAIARCYDKGNKADAARIKLRRIITCTTIKEVSKILRPLLGLIHSHNIRISYNRLLNDLLYYGEKTRLQWASDFYGGENDDSLNI